MQAVPFAAAANRKRIEPRGLHQNILCFLGDHRFPAAHYTGERQGFCFVRHHQVFGIEYALDSIERPQLFTLARAAQNNATLQFVAIEGMCGMPHSQGDVVGSIHRVRYKFLLQQLESLLYRRGGWLDANATKGARSEAAAQIGSFNQHSDGFGRRQRHRKHSIERDQRQRIDRRDFPCDAIVVHSVDAVGGNVHLEKRAIGRTEIEDSVDSDTAQSKRLGQFAIAGREAR